MKFIELTAIYYKDDSWKEAGKILVNPRHIVRISPNEINGLTVGCYIDTVNDHSGYSLKVKEKPEEIKEMLR